MNKAKGGRGIRALVDRERFSSSISLGVRDKLPAEALELVYPKLGEHGRVAWFRIIRFTSVQLVHEPRNVRELLRSLDHRVRGEDLFNQRRPGARQSYDENG